MKITILGCGASAGVPLVGCECAVCASENPRNKRTRASIFIERGEDSLLVDTSPDLRQQCLANGIKTTGAILFTHAHADHCHGMDDVRSLNYHKGGPIDMFTDTRTLAELEKRFGYAFKPHDTNRYVWYKPWLQPHGIPLSWPALPEEEDSYTFTVGAMEVIVFRQRHGGLMSLGLRIGDFAYSTDVSAFPASAEAYLEGLDVWVVDCLRPHPAPTHAHLEKSLEWIAAYRPKRAILTHMSHDMDYDTLLASLPQGVEPAYDGMVLTVD